MIMVTVPLPFLLLFISLLMLICLLAGYFAGSQYCRLRIRRSDRSKRPHNHMAVAVAKSTGEVER